MKFGWERKNLKYRGAAVGVAMLAVASVGCYTVKHNQAADTPPPIASTFGKDGYVKSATYFGEEWPVNFWNSDTNTLPDDMKRIHADGFDSIILIVPWREFQSTVDPIAYNDYAFGKLDSIMQAAAKEQLGVYLRIGYTWDFFNDTDGAVEDRFIDVFYDDTMQKAWREYVSTLYQSVRKHANFKGAYLTWEDFSPFMSIIYKDENDRKRYAEKIGYKTWLESHYSLQDYNEKFSTDYKTLAAVPIPKSGDAEMREYYRLFDNLQIKLLDMTQKIFPNISMEVRLDEDMIVYPDGKKEPYIHKLTYPCGNADFTAVMYGIPMGFVNKGEKVTAKQAMGKTEEMLYKLKTQNGGKPIYVEQFIFADNTPGFSHNAQIKPDDLSSYLQNVDDVLRHHSSGYGIWTYRNYRVNLIYNPGFFLAQTGWEKLGRPEYADRAGNNVCALKNGDGIRQHIPTSRMFHFSDETDIPSCTFSMDVTECKTKSAVTVTVGDVTQQVELSGEKTVELQFPKQKNMDVQILAAEGEFCIDNIRLYSYVQNGYIYDEFGREMKHAKDIRILNDRLSRDKAQ